MSFGESIRTCFSKYATFTGRASRAEFWWFYLFVAIINLILVLPYYGLAIGASLVTDSSVATVLLIASTVWLLIWMAASIALLIPFIAAGCRRLHDSGKSGWLLLLLLVPCGGIALVVLWVLEATPGENFFGPPPR